MARDYSKYTDEQLHAFADQKGVELDPGLSHEELVREVSIMTSNSVNRFFLVFFLLENRSRGVSRQEIIDRFYIKNDRTFSRMIKDLEQFADFVTLTIEEDRYYACLNPSFEKQRDRIDELTDMLLQLLCPLGKTGQPEILRINLTGAVPEPDVLNNLFNSAVNNSILSFMYKNKNHSGFCLGLCVHNNSLYAFMAVEPNNYKLTFRVDMMQNISFSSLIAHKTASFQTASSLRKELYERISSSQNIWVNLNKDSTFDLRFRFRLSPEIIRAEISNARSISFPDAADKTVQDLTLDFRGKREAFAFMQRWLGSYSVICENEFSEAFVNSFIDDITEKLGEIEI